MALWALLGLLLILWLVGTLGSVGGSFIHILMVVSLIVVIMELLNNRRPVV